MFTLSKQDFDNLKPRNGIVVVEIDRVFHTKTDLVKLVANSNYSMAQNAVKHGVVVKVPDKNTPEGFSGKQYVPLIKKGDIVHFDYTLGLNVLLSGQGVGTNNDNLLSVEGKRYLLVPYSMCFYFEREGQTKSLNGYVIASKVKRKVNVFEMEEPDLFVCEMECTEAIFDRQATIPKKGDKFYYDGSAVPTEPEYLGEKQLFRLWPFNIYATK